MHYSQGRWMYCLSTHVPISVDDTHSNNVSGIKGVNLPLFESLFDPSEDHVLKASGESSRERSFSLTLQSSTCLMVKSFWMTQSHATRGQYVLNNKDDSDSHDKGRRRRRRRRKRRQRRRRRSWRRTRTTTAAATTTATTRTPNASHQA